MDGDVFPEAAMTEFCSFQLSRNCGEKNTYVVRLLKCLSDMFGSPCASLKPWYLYIYLGKLYLEMIPLTNYDSSEVAVRSQ